MGEPFNKAALVNISDAAIALARIEKLLLFRPFAPTYTTSIDIISILRLLGVVRAQRILRFAWWDIMLSYANWSFGVFRLGLHDVATTIVWLG